jgi:hypothetical protein
VTVEYWIDWVQGSRELLKNSRFEMDLDLCTEYGMPKIESRSSLWHLKSSTRNLGVDF